MTQHYNLVMRKNNKIVALQDITRWTEQQIEDLWLIQKRLGRECEIKKYFKEEKKR